MPRIEHSPIARRRSQEKCRVADTWHHDQNETGETYEFNKIASHTDPVPIQGKSELNKTTHALIGRGSFSSTLKKIADDYAPLTMVRALVSATI